MPRHVALFRWTPETTSAVQDGNADFALVADAVLQNLIRPIHGAARGDPVRHRSFGLTLP